ncbi:alpha/beta hydrolase [Brevundimonas sp.]|uniref:alpha/beta fold hydrolase n=1 Tax=Brevundimonas sp. TaxID=1871086 RepID=UPI0025E231A2|nr:alpha/beta hydrolase [Brevundimonas sp.]
MHRRNLLIGIGGLTLAACATTPTRAPFISDRIGVTAQGSGPDVILIPGLTSHPEIWDDTAAHLAGRYRVHRVWVSGFAGRPAEANASGEQVGQPVAAEIARYIAEQGLARPAVIGHSMGGWIGMVLAARHPDLVGRLMVVDMLPFMGAMFGPPGVTPDQLRPIADQIRDGIRNTPLDGREAQAAQTIAGMVRTESLRAGPIRHTLESDYDVAGRAFHELVVTDLRPELSNITAPVTVLYVTPTGAPLTDAQLDAFYQLSYANVPGARLVRVPDAAHFIMFDNPTRFFAEVDAFLSAE